MGPNKNKSANNMKRVLTTIVILAMTVAAVMAQSRAVGIRGGYNFEVSYQHSLSSGMLEVDAGITPFLYSTVYTMDENGDLFPQTQRYGRAQLSAFYDWLMNITTNLNWYVGLGVGVSWGYGEFFEKPHYDKNGTLTTYRRLGLPAGGQIGIEYNLKIPLNLSLDWRPMFNLFNLRQDYLVHNLLNFAVGVRYRL